MIIKHECKITVLEMKNFPELKEKYLADHKYGSYQPGNDPTVKDSQT